MEGLPITVTDRTDGAERIEVRTPSGHAFSLPRDLVPADCGTGGTFPLDLGTASAAMMPDDVRHRMSRALLNELMTSSEATT